MYKDKSVSKSILTVCALVSLLLASSCAQVPKESVQLSTTVGRDIAEVHKSHRELANILFARMKADINKFVDEVYAPYQINALLKADQQDFKAGDPNSLFYSLDSALKNPTDLKAQNDALVSMEIFLQVTREEIESYRAERMAPILVQEKEMLGAIDRSYNQIHYANSIVTGHLASIVKVYDAQEKILNEFGVEGLRSEAGQKLADASTKVAELLENARKIDTKAEGVSDKITELTGKLDSYIEKINAKE